VGIRLDTGGTVRRPASIGEVEEEKTTAGNEVTEVAKVRSLPD
jgi:hypothetical protein